MVYVVGIGGLEFNVRGLEGVLFWKGVGILVRGEGILRYPSGWGLPNLDIQS